MDLAGIGIAEWWMTSFLILIFIGLLTYRYLSLPKSFKYPPSYGWLPYIGCALEFGKAPLLFIQNAAQQLGPVFTLKVAGKRLTFITQLEDYKHFFQSENVDFQIAVQQPVQNAASVSTESFFQNHTKIHDIVKARLAPSCLGSFCEVLSNKFDMQFRKFDKKGAGDLNEIVRSTMYTAVLDNLFGEGVLPTSSKETFKELESHFVIYDDHFEYGSQIPEFFLRDWTRSKHWLLALFKSAVYNVRKSMHHTSNADTVFQNLIKVVDFPHAHNYGLLLMWASLANAIPITFWTLAFILSHEDIAKEVKKEISNILENGGKGNITQEDIIKMPMLKKCVLETIRLRSPGVITRGVKKTFVVKGFTIPKGDLLMLSPYWAHRNEHLFPDPESFKPERWDKVDINKNTFLEGFVAFGGGRYQCPGRWFAMMEIQLYIAIFLHHFDIQLLDNVPPLSSLHIVGTQQPVGPLKIQYTSRI